MAKHNTQYIVNNEVFHFETEGKSVIIYDDNNNQIGTLNDVFLKGKVVTGVDYKSIKTTGIYNTQGLKNLPASIPSNQKAILSVTAIGSTNSPDVILYRIIGANGAISENTVSGSFESGWTDSGIGLKNQINIINNNIAQANQKNQDNANSINLTNKSLSDLTNKFNNHNHDGRYLSKNGDTINGDLVIGKGHLFSTVRDNNQIVSFIDVAPDDTAWLGDSNLNLKITSKSDVTINGKRIFTEGNVGSGSGLDADKLDGIDSSSFLRVDKKNSIANDFEITRGNGVILKPDTSDANAYSKLTAEYDGLYVNVNGADIINFCQDEIWSHKSLIIDSSNNETHFEFGKGSAHSGKIGFYYNDGREEMGAYDWGHDKFIMAFSRQGKGIVDINDAPYVQGRRLFLQNDRPSGDIPYGSVWIGF